MRYGSNERYMLSKITNRDEERNRKPYMEISLKLLENCNGDSCSLNLPNWLYEAINMCLYWLRMVKLGMGCQIE